MKDGVDTMKDTHYNDKKETYPTSVSEPEDNNMKHDMQHYHEKKTPYPTSVSELEDTNP